MSFLGNPIDDPQGWDYVLVAGHISPGRCEVSNAKRSQAFDVKRGKGARGATLTYTGVVPAEPRIKLWFWLPQHFDQWNDFLPLLQYDGTKAEVKAVAIYYPSLADVGISSIVVKDIGAIEYESTGLYSVTIETIEYLPPPKASEVSTPTTSQTGARKSSAGSTTGAAGDPPDPVTERQQKEIAALLVKAQAP